jgi:hypothetical protein
LLLALHGVEVGIDAATDTVPQFDAFATRLHFDEGGARYAFEIKAADRIVLSGQAMLKMQEVQP